MAIARVQTAENGVSSNVVSVTWGSSTTTGNILIAVVSVTENHGNAAGTVTAPSGWSTAVGPVAAASGDNVLYIFYKENAASQSSTGNFTSSLSAGRADMQAIVAEYSGVATSSSLDKTASNSGLSATALDTGTTATTTQADELLIGGYGDSQGTSTFSSPTNSFSIYNQNNQGITDACLVDRIVSATGAYTTAITLSSAAPAWGGAIATFKQAAAAGSVGKFFPWFNS